MLKREPPRQTKIASTCAELGHPHPSQCPQSVNCSRHGSQAHFLCSTRLLTPAETPPTTSTSRCLKKSRKLQPQFPRWEISITKTAHASCRPQRRRQRQRHPKTMTPKVATNHPLLALALTSTAWFSTKNSCSCNYYTSNRLLIARITAELLPLLSWTALWAAWSGRMPRQSSEQCSSRSVSCISKKTNKTN